MSKYDDAISALDNERERERSAVNSAAGQFNPDQYAKALTKSRETGVPAHLIAKNPEPFNRPNKYEAALDAQDAPTTAEWMSNFDNAAVAQDDRENLSGLERAMRLMRKGYDFDDRIRQRISLYPQAGAAGGIQATGSSVSGLGRLLEAGGRLTERGVRAVPGGDWLADIETPWWMTPGEILRRPGEVVERQAARVDVPEDQQGIDTDIVKGVGQIGAQVITQWLTGGTGSTLTLFGQGADVMGDRAEAAGATPEQTDAAVLAGASITALTERYGLDALLNRVPPQIKNAVLSRLADIAVGGGIEAAQEAVEGVLHNLTAKAVFDPNTPIFEGIGREATAAGGAGALARAVIGAIVPGRQMSFADQDRATAEQIAQVAQQSKLATRSPEKLEELVSQIKAQTGSEFAYLDPAAFRTLYQSDQEAAQAAADLTGSPTTYFEAAVSNTKMAVPIEKYVARIAANKSALSLLDHVTFTPDGMTAEEAKTDRELLEGQAKEIADREITDVRPDSSQAIYDDVLGQLLGTGMERSTAEKNAALAQVVFRTLGQRAGIDPRQLYERYGLKVQRHIPGAGTVKRVDAAIDPLIDQLRAGDIPSPQQAFGESLLEFIRAKGGLKDEGGELAARDIDKGGKAFQRNIIQKAGRTLDDMAELLVESGYISERDPNAVLDLISKELSGAPVYAAGNVNSVGAGRRAQVEWLEEMISRAGLDLKTADNEAIKKALNLNDERAALLDYLPSVEELTDSGLAGVDEAFEVALVTRATEMDAELVERLAVQYAEDDSGFISAVRAFLNEQDAKAASRSEESSGPQEGLTSFDQRFDETRRGAIQFGTDRQFTISLLEKADLSTYLHESGHFYLEILADLAEDATAPQQIKDDFAAVLKWMGVKDRASIQTDQHEQWARGFEAYLMEGKSPSVEMQSVFARFRAWLVAVYKTLARLNVELTDDVRRVMDRLVATDDEIAAAEESQNYAPIFANAEAAGMSPEQWAAYKDIATRAHQEAVSEMTDRAMKELSREQKAWWKEERAKVRDTVLAEVNQQPVYRALAFLQKGTNSDGSALPEGVQATKLNKQALVDKYGKDFLKRLPRGLTAKEGIHPDIAGQMFGFDSGDALVEALANARPKAQLIEMEADARMREKYGDMLTDGSLAEQAMQSVHTEGRAKVMAAELKALNRKRREVKPFIKAAKDQAAREQRQSREANAATLPDADELKAIKLAVERIIQGKKIRDIQPNLYRTAEAKAARKAFELASKGKYEEAYIEKRRQILNHELYRAAVKAREEVDSIVEYMRTFDKKATRERIAKAKGEYLEQIDALRERFDFSRVSNIADLKRTALARWVAEQEAAGREVNVPEYLLNEARKTPYKELLLAELQGLHDAVANIEHLAKTKDRLLKNRKAAEWDVARTELADRLEGQSGKAPPVSKFERTDLEEFGAIANELADSWLRPETIVEWLDGGESGPWHDYLMEPANNAEYKRETLREQVLRPLRDLAEKVTRKRRTELHESVTIKSLGKTWDRRTLLSIVLNMGNKSNLERLLQGGFRDGGEVREFTQAALDEIVSKLNAEDVQFLNTAWKTVEQLWPEVVDFQKRMGGLVPEKIVATPIQTPHGELTGGYWPAVYDSLASRAGQKQAEASDAIQTIMGANFTRASTKKGHTKGRTAVAGPLLLDYSAVAGRHVEQVITDLTHREFALQAMRILDDSGLRLKLQDAAGETAWQSLRGMVRHAVEQDGGYSEAANRGQERIMRRLISNTAVAALGFRAVTAWGNMVLAPIQAGARISPKHIAIGLGRFYRHPVDSTKFIHSVSEMMSQRARNMDHTFNVVMQTLEGKRGFRAKVAQASMSMHSTADYLATHGLWLGRYQEALDAGESHEEAVRLADKSIRQTQTAGAPKDLSAFERDPKHAMFKLFLGPMLIQGNRIRESLGRKGVVQNWPQAFGTLMAAWFLPAVLWDLMTGRGPDDDDDDGIADDAALWALRKIFVYPFLTMPYIRDAASLAERKIEGKFAEPRMTPLADAGYLVFQAGQTAWNEAGDWMDGEDFEANKAIRSGLRASGPLFGIPSNQIDVTGSYLYDLATDEEDFEGLGDLRYLAVRR